MEKATAFAQARDVLDLLIENQPDLFTEPNAVARGSGAKLADFCHDFMEQYAKRLISRAE